MHYQFHGIITCQWHRCCDVDLLPGADCPFAHTEEELLPMPDLAKTKMCYNYFRRTRGPGDTGKTPGTGLGTVGNPGYHPFYRQEMQRSQVQVCPWLW